MINDRKITVSVGASRKETNWLPQTMMVSQLWDMLKTPVRGTEALAEYKLMRKSQQDNLKDVGGFVGGELTGRRKKGNVKGRDLIALDMDNLPPGTTDEIIRRVAGLGCSFAIYTTRKHCPEKPRLRILVVTDRTMTPEEYAPIARKLAQMIQPEMTWFDPTTFQMERLMYWPSCCADGQYVFKFGDRKFLSADGMLAKYTDWHDMSEWPTAPDEQQKALKSSAAKQGDPTEKNGPVGAFCRTYDIPAAMEAFIPGVYTETATPGRYTYTGGSTAGGAVLYDDDKFLYSWHATDPCGGNLVNSFDMVRLHKFGELDDAEDVKDGTPTNRLPSYKAMVEFAENDAAAGALLKQERGKQMLAEFSGIAEEENQQDLEAFLGGIERQIVDTEMVRQLLQVLGITIRMEVVTNEVEISGVEKRNWSRENAVNNLPILLTDLLRKARVKGANVNNVQGSLSVIVDENRYNAVEEILKTYVWDKQDRIQELFEIMGLVKDKQSQTLVYKWLLQTIAMALNNEDNPYGAEGVLILQGGQGVGKTSLARFLALTPRLFREGVTIDMRVKDTIIRATSAWITEMGEIETMLRRNKENLKALITNTSDNERKPYARSAVDRPRRTSFIGTLNSEEYLRDATGTRRFWTIPADGIDKDRMYALPEDWWYELWAQVYADWLRLGPQCFRLTAEERAALEKRNTEYAEMLPGEAEIRQILNLETMPESEWRWVSPAAIAAFAGRGISAKNAGWVMTRLQKQYPRIEKRRSAKGIIYKIPLDDTFTIT